MHNGLGLSKAKPRFKSPPQHSVPWGGHIISGTEVDDGGIFRIVSHNVDGLSLADNNADMVHMAASMADIAVALFGLQETNRNFERQRMADSYHQAVRRVSTHYHGLFLPQNFSG